METCLLALQLLKRNAKGLLIFELVYKLLAVIVCTPLIMGLLNIGLKSAGISYISNDNFWSFLASPTTICIVFMIMVGLTMYSLLDMAAVIYCLHGSYCNRTVSPGEMFYAGFESIKTLLHRQNWLLIMFVLGVLPLTNIALIPGSLLTIKIPEFIMSYIHADVVLFIVYLLFSTLLLAIMLRWITSIHCFVLENISFKDSRRQSSQLVQGNYSSTILTIILWDIVIAIVLLLIGGTLLLTIALAAMILQGYKAINILALICFVAGIVLLVGTYSLFSTPISFALISGLYYRLKEKSGQKVEQSYCWYQGEQRRRLVYGISIILVLGLLFNSAYVFSLWNGMVNPLIHTPVVMAHRGDSISAPENTKAAFESALRSGAEYIELDVQQTKDGQIVVMHDSNLWRIAGIKQNIWDINYEELKDIDVGQWFSPQFVGTTISTLDEVIHLVKGRAKLNIELKPNGHEVGLEEAVAKIIQENDFERQCFVASLDYNSLKRMKEIDPTIETVYVMSVAYGDITNLAAADGFSVEASCVSKTLVNLVHSKGKEIYAWTVNEEESIKRMLGQGVDGIITDEPVKAKEIIYRELTSDSLEKLIDVVLEGSQ